MGYPSTVDTGQIQPTALYQVSPAVWSTLVFPTANQAYFVPMLPLLVSATLTGIRVRFNPGGNGHYDVGIYSDNNGAPGTLLAHAAATVTSLATSTGVLTPSLIGGNLALSPGVYWLALWIDNATDKVLGATPPVAGIAIAMSGANGANVLPSSASSITPTDATLQPSLVGLFLGGWS